MFSDMNGFSKFITLKSQLKHGWENMPQQNKTQIKEEHQKSVVSKETFKTDDKSK